jgi:hypothetical protein
MLEPLIALISVGIGYALCYFVMRDSVKITQATLQTILDERKPVVRATRSIATPTVASEPPSEPDSPREPTVIVPETIHQAFVPPDLIGLRNNAFQRGEKVVKEKMEMMRIAEDLGMH